MSHAAPHAHAGLLAFREVDPARDAQMLVAFGRDLYVESVGDARGFEREFGRRGKRFPLWIASCAARGRDFTAILTRDDVEIGLVVLGVDPRDCDVGHIHHLYVKPEWRGCGYGGLLDEYARETLRAAGFSRIRLNVTTRNARALRFYIAQGWRDIGGSPSGLRYMEVRL